MTEQQLTFGFTLGPLIGLYSPVAGSGKSEVARVLCEEHGYTRVKFADGLKLMTSAFLAYLGYAHETIDRMIEGDLKEATVPEVGVSPRRLMQTLGTEWGREAVCPDLWVRATMARVNVLRTRGIPVVVDDVRFPNEHAALTEAGAYLVTVYRPDAPRGPGHHRSEGTLDDALFDDCLVNDGTLDDLRAAARTLPTDHEAFR